MCIERTLHVLFEENSNNFVNIEEEIYTAASIIKIKNKRNLHSSKQAARLAKLEIKKNFHGAFSSPWA